MKKTNKVIVLLLSVIFVLTFTACNTDEITNSLSNNISDIQQISTTATITSPADDAEVYTVSRVVDGDTFIINDNGEEVRVRLIGVDTPESVSSDSSKNCTYGKVASEYTTNLLLNKEIVLEYDVDNTDTYGRTLAYAYLDGVMVNYTLVANGYAVAKEYPPSTKYADVFENAQIEAQNSKVGMWSDDVSNTDCNLKSKYYIE